MGIMHELVAGQEIEATKYNENLTKPYLDSVIDKNIPAYEALSVGDLLKMVNDGGTMKVRKIKGIGSNITATSTDFYNLFNSAVRMDWISDNIVVFAGFYNNNLYCCIGTISGATMTMGSVYSAKSDNTISAWRVKATDATQFIVAYRNTNGDIYAKAATISGSVITFGSEGTIATAQSSGTYIDMAKISTGKVGLAYKSGYGNCYARVLSASGTTLTVGAQATVIPSNYVQNWITVCKVATDKFIVFCSENNVYDTYYAVCSVSGTTITYTDPVGTFINGGGSNNNLCVNLHAAYVSDNVIIVFYTKNGSTTTLLCSYCTISTLSLTIVGTDSFSSSYTASSVYNIICFDNWIYFYDGARLCKYAYSTGGTFVLVKAYTISYIGGLPFILNTDKMLFVLGTAGPDKMYFKHILLDHDEFVGCANGSFSAGDIVLLSRIFTGLSNLLYGHDYYINAQASGLTISSTYQKVGKAISATEILKY
jgi:hypothetical protein